MRTYKLTISYDGTRYQGWQRQATTDNTIQHILEWSIGKLVGYRVRVDGSGRTDAGVHARGQVASVQLSKLYDVKELKDKAGEAVDSMNNAMGDINSKWSGMSKFFRNIFNGNGLDMFGSFFSNLGKGKVSGLSLAGLVAAAYLIFGRFGWLGKIAGTMLGMMLVGNNANLNHMMGSGNAGERRSAAVATAEDTQVRGMRR